MFTNAIQGCWATAGVSPDAPQILSATATATGITLSLVAAAPTDRIYVRLRRQKTDDAWTPESLTLSRVGTGTLDVVLSARAYWEVVAYAKNLTAYSVWTDPVIVTAPTTIERASVQEAFVWILKNDPAFVDICGGRLFPDVAEPGDGRKGPYAVYGNPAGYETDHFLGTSALCFDTIQLECVSQSAEKTESLFGAARDALLGWRGDVILDDGRQLLNTKIRLVERHEEFSNPIGGAGKGMRRSISDWQISYNEEIPAT